MGKYFNGATGNAKPWSSSTESGPDVESRLSMTTTFCPEGGAVESSTTWVKPFTTWHSAVRTTKK